MVVLSQGVSNPGMLYLKTLINSLIIISKVSNTNEVMAIVH